MNPAEAERIAAERQAELDQLQDMREELLHACQHEGHKLPAVGEPDLLIAGADPAAIQEWFAEYKKKLDSDIDEEMAQSGEEALGARFAIQPDDPDYNPMRDVRRRETLEAKLEPIDFGTMVFHGYAEQTIPIREDFTIVLRTIAGDQGLWLEEYIANQEPTSQAHAAHWFSLLQLGLSVQSINGKAVGSELAKIEDKQHFWKESENRLKTITKYPDILLNELIVQYNWFLGRVRKVVQGTNLARKVGNS
jgi:hypothetical protein